MVDHTLHANRRGFEAIFLSYTKTNKKKIFTEENAQTYAYDLRLSLLELTIQTCFGLSKQTIVEEIHKEADYHRLTFIEFLEFSARLLYAKFVQDLERGHNPDGAEPE